MGIDDELAHTSIRFSLSRFTTAEEIDRAAAVIRQLGASGCAPYRRSYNKQQINRREQERGKMAKNDLIGGSLWEQYSAKVSERMNNPRHRGEISEEEAKALGARLVVADWGAESCGDAVRLYWAVDPKTDRILAAKFKSFGCGTAIASSDMMAELSHRQDRRRSPEDHQYRSGDGPCATTPTPRPSRRRKCTAASWPTT